MNETENFVDADGTTIREDDLVKVYLWDRVAKEETLMATDLQVTLNIDADIVDGQWVDTSCASLLTNDGDPLQYVTFDPRTGESDCGTYYILKQNP